jgi:hypothetical protein
MSRRCRGYFRRVEDAEDALEEEAEEAAGFFRTTGRVPPRNLRRFSSSYETVESGEEC